VDDHVVAPDSNILDMTNLSLAAWIFVPDYSQDNSRSGWMIMEKRPHDGCWELLHFALGRLLLRGASSAGNMSDAGVIKIGEWMHVVGTITGGEGALYVNGRMIKNDAVTPVRPSSGEVLIGMGRNAYNSDD
jgi:hypothetical protein